MSSKPTAPEAVGTVLELVWGAGTDTGLRRQRNEDAFLASALLFAVADGMGGHARGDVAAALAIRTLARLIPSHPGGADKSGQAPLLTNVSTSTRDGNGSLVDGASDETGSSKVAASHLSRSRLLDAVREADRMITAEAVHDPERPMGTTLCGLGVLLADGATDLIGFNVGDSRLYRLRNGHLDQLSQDHSVVQELIDLGELDPELAELHPERNVITRSLGSGEPLDVDWWTIEAEAHDRLMLCSDGLVKEVTAGQIRDLLSTGDGPQEACDKLISAAIESGGRDNVTVVVVDVVSVAPASDNDFDLGHDTNPREHVVEPTKPRPDRTQPAPVRRGSVMTRGEPERLSASEPTPPLHDLPTAVVPLTDEKPETTPGAGSGGESGATAGLIVPSDIPGLSVAPTGGVTNP